MPYFAIALASFRRARPVIALAAVAAVSPTAAAQDAPAYQVELIVFEHAEPFPAGETFDLSRTSPFVPTFADRLPLLSDDDASEQDDEVAAPPEPRRLADYPAVAQDELVLSETARRLANATRFDVLDHAGWRQDALPTDEAPLMRVQAGGVRGTVLLSRSRFLRLDVELNFVVDGQPVSLEQSRRRVQLDKPHYIDHPYVGAIIQVSRAPSDD